MMNDRDDRVKMWVSVKEFFDVQLDYIEKLEAVHRIASKLVNKTSGWRNNFGHKLPEDWVSWMEDLEKAINEVSDDRRSGPNNGPM